MKKFLLSTVALVALVSFSSCSNDLDVNPSEQDGLATIRLNISSDIDFVSQTRATAENSAWFAQIDDQTQGMVSDLLGKTYSVGSHTITVSNHASLASAMSANSGAGAAYYEKSKQETLHAGVNSVSIDCGRAQNCRLKADWSGTSGVSGLTVNSVVASQTTSSRSYTYTSDGTTAYFYASEQINCVIHYTHNGVSKTISKSFDSPAAATEYHLVVSANSNGTIVTIEITFDDTFSTGESSSTTIDAATGEEVTNAK